MEKILICLRHFFRSRAVANQWRKNFFTGKWRKWRRNIFLKLNFSIGRLNDLFTSRSLWFATQRAYSPSINHGGERIVQFGDQTTIYFSFGSVWLLPLLFFAGTPSPQLRQLGTMKTRGKSPIVRDLDILSAHEWWSFISGIIFFELIRQRRIQGGQHQHASHFLSKCPPPIFW